MAYATPADITSRLGRDLDASETQIASIRLNDAELLIRARIRDLDAQVTAGTIDQGILVMVEADAVLRLVRNPDGYTNEQDGNYSYSIDQSVASGRLSILDEEWTLLGVRRSAFVIAPRVSIPWCEPRRDDPFAPPVHNPVHPAVWWAE